MPRPAKCVTGLICRLRALRLDVYGTNWFHICMVDTFDALAHPARRALLDELRMGPRPAGELGASLDISREAVSKHLRLMAESGLLIVETQGRQRIYAINPDALAAVDTWLVPYRAFWDQHLDALETEVARGRRHTDRLSSNRHPFSKGA